jgi:hypothetical protein
MSVAVNATTLPVDSAVIEYKLHGQTRRYSVTFRERGDSLLLSWGIERNTKWQSGSYCMTPNARKNSTMMCYVQPIDEKHITINSSTFAIISSNALAELKNTGKFHYNNTVYRLSGARIDGMGNRLISAIDTLEGSKIEILDNQALPLVVKMADNPVEINWTIKLTERNSGPKRYISANPGASGGIYYAYPYTADEWVEAPTGYKPFYVSHYGRHGSRWILKEWQHPLALALFAHNDSANNLTAKGKEIYKKIQDISANAEGNYTLLSPVGVTQHREISKRLVKRYPQIFAQVDTVRAFSSVIPRCIKSMKSFCGALNELYPNVKIVMDSDSVNMEYIAYDPAEKKKQFGKDSDFQKRYAGYTDSLLHPERLMATLFVNPDSVPEQKKVMKLLHDIAVDVQDVDIDEDFLDIFNDDELFALWQNLNYSMYMKHANCPASGAAGPTNAYNLLRNIIEDADKAVSGEKARVTLRFGHDTHLIRLLALMGVDGCANAEQDCDNYYKAWQDFRISPMGANLQMIFSRNDAGNVIVLLRLNEQIVTLPIATAFADAPYYDWATLRAYLIDLVK